MYVCACTATCVLRYMYMYSTYIEAVFSEQHEGGAVVLQEVRQRSREENKLLQQSI